MTLDTLKLADLYQKIATVFATADGPPAPPTPPPAPAPTLPILTLARLAAFKSMAAANHPAWLRLKAIADASKQPGPNGDDPGLAAAIVGRVTGDASYFAAAWLRLIAYAAIPTSAPYDSVSDGIVETAVVYSWLKDTATPDIEAQFAANLTSEDQVAVGTSKVVTGGIPPSNANYAIPFYFGLALTDAITGSNYLSQTSNQSGIVLPVGGLDSTAADRSTARNCIRQYVEVLSAGGTWCEGPYEDKSLPRLIVGWMALRDLLGVDHFPEIAKYVPAACDAKLLDYAADFTGVYLWGDRTRLDDDYARRLSIYVALQAACVRLGDTARAANMGYLIQNLLAKVPWNQIDTHFWFFYDPSCPIGKRPADPIVNYSPGVGLVSRADGNTLFAAFGPSTIDLNHEQDAQDIFLYAGGEVALGRPDGYALQLAGIDIQGQMSGNCYGTNGVAICGLTKMQQSGLVDFASTADYTYWVYQTKGLLYGKGANNPQTEWLHELTRTGLYLPALGLIFVCDRANLDDPRKLPADELAKYGAAQGPVQNAVNLVEQVWHCPVKPNQLSTPTLATLSWDTPGGQHIELDAFSPTGALAVDVVDENVLWKDVSAIDPDQKKWQFRVRPAVAQQFNVIVSCYRLNPGTAAPIAITSSDAAGFSLGSIASGVVRFGTGQASRLLDTTTPPISSAKTTYLVGCSGPQPVVVK